MNKSVYLLALCAALLQAQDSEKAAVPLHDPSRPAHIQVQILLGGITVRGADIKDVEVETNPRPRKHSREPQPDTVDGMKRLEQPGVAGLEIEEDNNEVKVKTAPWAMNADIVLIVPRHSSLKLKTLSGGDINVEQVDGEIDANNLNGKITLKHVSGSVVAHSLNGAVTATLDRVDAGKPMSFSTMNGNIDVTLPGDLKANVMMKTDNGSIYSDFDVNLNSRNNVKPIESGKQPDGTYRLRFDRALRGTINGGGPEFQFISFNGQIYIRRKK